MNGYSPSSLPAVSAIEVVDLRRVNPSRGPSYMECAAGAPSIRCDDERVAQVANWWRSLPPGEVIRCHTPPIGVRFYAGSTLVCEASVCWGCENLVGRFEGRAISCTFDPRSEPGMELFSLLQSIIGAEVLASESSDGKQMHWPPKVFSWPAPWSKLELSQAAPFERQLLREVGSGHPLNGIDCKAIGRSGVDDDVVFATTSPAMPVALVHLTWSSTPQNPNWPHTVGFPSWHSFRQAVSNSDE